MSWRFPLCVLLIACGCSGEWKPTGDGRTIVHTRTGEIRVTSTAEPVEKYNEREKSEAVVRAAESKRQEQKLEAERLRLERRKDQARAALAMEAEREAHEQERARALRNGTHYHAIQLLVCNMPRSEVEGNYCSGWFEKKPYRLDHFPTKSERDELVELVDSLFRGSTVSRDKWSILLNHLKALEYDDRGRGEWLKTAEQVAESAAALKLAADREAKSVQGLKQ